jgi:hypothetical protein
MLAEPDHVLVCSRVADAATVYAADFTAPCYLCAEVVFISKAARAQVMEAAGAAGYAVICSRCFLPRYLAQGGQMVAPSEAVKAEIVEALKKMRGEA